MIRRAVVLSSLLFVLAGSLSAQAAFVPRTHLSVFGGLSVPTGDIGAINARNPNAGFAQFGFAGGTEILVTPIRHLETGIMGVVSYNPRDEAAITNAMSARGAQAVALTGWWRVISAVGSAGLATWASPTVEVYGRGYLGVAFAREPEIDFLSNDEWFVQEEAKATTMTYGFGVGMRISGLDVALRLLTAKPTYEFTTTPSKGDPVKSSATQPTTFYHVTVGCRIF